jgi:hypothetical protein
MRHLLNVPFDPHFDPLWFPKYGKYHKIRSGNFISFSTISSPQNVILALFPRDAVLRPILRTGTPVQVQNVDPEPA